MMLVCWRRCLARGSKRLAKEANRIMLEKLNECNECKVGDVIYLIVDDLQISKTTVDRITKSEAGIINIYAHTDKLNPRWKGYELKEKAFGVVAFLNVEAAENKIKELNHKM